MFDVLTIAAVADELAETLLDGRIQRVGLIDRLTVAAEVYAGGQRHALVVSAANDDARIHLAERLPSLDPALITPFGLLVRKYLRGGVLISIEQPPLERIIRLSIAKRLRGHNEGARGAQGAQGAQDEGVSPSAQGVPADASGGGGGEGRWLEGDEDDEELIEGVQDATYVHLVVEVMGRHSNLILVADDGRIMESAKHVSPQMSRVRPIRPRLPYTPPPPLEKPDPRRLTTAETVALLENQASGATLAQVLVRSLRAISPQMGREIVFRATGDAGTTVAGLGADGAATLARETRALFEPLLTAAWAPRVYLDRESEEPVAFSPIPLGHLAASLDEEVEETISAAIERAREGSGTGLPVDHAQRRARLIQVIDGGRHRLRGRLASLAQQAAKATEAERLRTWGELIYAYLWQIQPGQSELVVDDQRIPLDPTVSAKENAQTYFERYRKAQGAAGALPELRAKTDAELAYLDQLRTMVEHASGFAELAALSHEWEAHQPSPQGGQPGKGKPKKEPATKRPRPLLDPEGNAVYIGRSGRQNDLVTFDLAGPDDTWLHARGVPGSHVVVRWRSSRAEEEPATIEAAAALAAYYSAARESGTVEVDVTRRKHVRKIKGAGPGMVTYRQERTIAVRPRPEDALKDTLAPSSPS